MIGKPPYSFSEQTEEYSNSPFHREVHIAALETAVIVEVWESNLHTEIEKISELAKKYSTISIDTEFPCLPGVFYCEKNTLFSKEHLQYQKLKKNVESSDLIQFGISLSDQFGNVPEDEPFTWQFNFKYEEDVEEVSPSSAQLLKQSGIDFKKLAESGIPYKKFAEEFLKSGLLFCKNKKWIAFHGCYDFSYLLSLLRNEPLPKNIESFYKTIKIYFPNRLDLKYLIRINESLRKLGLSKLATSLECRRIGPEHQAGSDSLLTLQCYNLLRQTDLFTEKNFQESENVIFGIGITEKSTVPNFSQFEEEIHFQDYESLQIRHQSGETYRQKKAQSQVLYMGNPLHDFLEQNKQSVGFSYPLRSSSKYQ